MLSYYSKAILCERMNGATDDYFLSTKVYSLPDMTENTNEGNVYIDFVEFTKQTSNSTSSSVKESETKGEDITLTAGKYTVGTDIKVGKYDAIAQAGSGNFFVHGYSSINEILSAKNDGFGIPKYSNLTLKNGDTVEITSNLSLLLQSK